MVFTGRNEVLVNPNNLFTNHKNGAQHSREMIRGGARVSAENDQGVCVCISAGKIPFFGWVCVYPSKTGRLDYNISEKI